MFKKKNLKITTIVPVYNNQKTIKRIIRVLLNCKFIDQLIAVNDGSQDKSLKILKSFKNKKFKLLNLAVNHGKGSAIEKALDLAKNQVLMIVDADLSRLKKKHITDLKNAFFTSQADLVIAARRYKFDSFLRKSLFDMLSGERIFFKKNIIPFRYLLKKVNLGFEQVINYAHRGKKIKKIFNHGTGHIMKFNRYRGRDMYKIPIVYIKEGWDVIKTGFIIKKEILFKNES